MKRGVIVRGLFLCGLFLSSVRLFGGACTPSGLPCAANTTCWHDNTNITDDIYASNGRTVVDVCGTNALIGSIHIIADTADMLVTITNGDAVITGSGAEAQLYLDAALGRIITFSLTQDLMFRGTVYDGTTTTTDLLVTVTGPGLVVFQILGDRSLTFTSLTTSGGARFYVGMSSGIPEVRFERMAGTATQGAAHSEIGVGPRSIMGYISLATLAASTNEQGIIEFDTKTTGTGRLILRLSHEAEVLISGRLFGQPAASGGDFTIGHINQQTLAGELAIFKVTNSTSTNFGSLLVINENRNITDLVINPFCDNAFTGTQYGFILGSNGFFQLGETTSNQSVYLDYVGTTSNQYPSPKFIIPDNVIEKGLDKQGLTKLRNGSAFIIDGSDDANASPAQMLFTGSSAVYLRSGVDDEGRVAETIASVISFTVNPVEVTKGPGQLVFDVEGELFAEGKDPNHEALHILSLHVTPTGGSILVRSGETLFPKRQFIKDKDGNFIRYNKAFMMINRRLYLSDVSLVHDDENHVVYEKDDIRSEATYVGGERMSLINLEVCSGNTGCTGLRPKMVFKKNAPLHVHNNIAFTGLDLLVTNSPTKGNKTSFIFYNNGRRVDAGEGRHMVLGTNEGAFASDGATIVDRTSHLDIMQEEFDPTPLDLKLSLTVSPNDPTINNSIDIETTFTDLLGQGAIHTIYLGHASNISIGTNTVGAVAGQEWKGTTSNCLATYTLTTTANLHISDHFFSFETRGGNISYPEVSNVTGEGGIFVDSIGKFDIEASKRANISTMVTKSRNGIIDLPKSQVFFDHRVGIAEWKLDLRDSTRRNIVATGTKLSDYTIDWVSTIKDYSTATGLVPYELYNVPDCSSPAVLHTNLRSLPEIHGTVDQLQIKRSRLGDMAYLKIGSGGFVKELVFLTGFDSAEAPVGWIVLEGDGRLGLGSAPRSNDSLEAAGVLGVNGITLVPNGNGEVLVNENLTVNNVCHILSGTLFGLSSPNYLTFLSENGKEIRVKKGGVLDLSSMTSTNQIIEFAGKTKLVLETGSTLVMKGGLLQFVGESELIVQRNIEDLTLASPAITTEDNVRAKIVGTGEVRMAEASRMMVREEASFGVETQPTCTLITTNIKWQLKDSAKVEIGSDTAPGGSWQIGNTTDQTSNSITFTLLLNGIGCSFEVGQRGFFGLGAGIVDKKFQEPANLWEIGSLFDVNNVTIDITNGAFINNTIVPGSDSYSSLLAIGGNSDATFTFTYHRDNAVIRGGGNIVKIEPSVTSINPTVGTTAGETVVGSLRVGIMGSRYNFIDGYGPAAPVLATGTTLFDFLKVRTITDYGFRTACISLDTSSTYVIGYLINATTILREAIYRVEGEGGTAADPQMVLDAGSARVRSYTASGRVEKVGTF